MKRKHFIFMLMAVLIALGSGSCSSKKTPDEIRNAKNSIDWEGVYTGKFIMPGNGRIANVSIRLYKDQSLEVNYEYADGSSNPINIIAPFKWDDTGNIIMMDAIDAPVLYKVEKDMLVWLDMDNCVLMKAR